MPRVHRSPLPAPPGSAPGALARRAPSRSRLGFLLLAVALLGATALPAPAETRPPANAREHWAFQPPAPAAPPKVRLERWARTEVDRFILAELERAGLTPAPAADPRTLIRRMSFDLTGLPPTPAEVTAFVAEARLDRDAAVGRLIDRLLARPAYGERWGRHWLDVARYSDTKGYVYGREERRFVHAPTYRDWVIRAFNEDLPYDRFLLLQIAADQLVPPGSPDLAAMGFVTGGRRFLGVTHDIIDDRIDVVTRGTMALTVQCARCHDHKYDPIPIEDYYSLYGVFHGVDEQLVPLATPGAARAQSGPAPATAPATASAAMEADAELAKRRAKLAEMMARRRAEAQARLSARLGDYLAAQLELQKYPEEGFDQLLSPDDLIPASVRRWRDYLRSHADAAHPLFAPWLALAGLPGTNAMAEARVALTPVLARASLNPLVAEAFADPPSSALGAARRYGAIVAHALRDTNAPGAAEWLAFLRDPHSPATVPDTGIVNNEQFFPTPVTEELWKLQGEVDRRLLELGTPAALVLTDRQPEPNPRVFLRGSPSKPGREVPRQFLEAVAGSRRTPFQQGSGRLELARAIASPQNPLTARVLVNRVWLHHFGTGLVKTPSDFGLRAETPSHPALLDWLSQRLVADGWSLKALHRLILSSAVYQQQSVPSPAAANVDPANRLLGHFPIRRLDFESVRDAMLAVGGELDRTVGGPARELLDANNTRRTVYAFVDRQFLPGTFRTFDFANPDIHVAVRHETTVPQQALFFLNGRFAADRARTLARQVSHLAAADRVQALHRALFQREARRDEVTDALAFIDAAQADAPPVPAAPRESAWRYGTGAYDETTGRLRGFAPLPHFTGDAWQGAAAFPGGATGWARLSAEGGHPGNTREQACVRRWIAPHAGTFRIRGTLTHEPEPGDGVRAFITSSRHGTLQSNAVHHGAIAMQVESVVLQAGDTLDFIVDIGGTLSYDQFLWAPVIEGIATAAATAATAPKPARSWDAGKEFSGPAPKPTLLSPWEQYAQVLLLSNEFAFAD